MLNIGSDRECFFDTYLLNCEQTTAAFRLHPPVYREDVLRHDAPWEGDGCNYHNFFFDDTYAGIDGKHPAGMYRMYYLAWQMPVGLPDSPGSEDILVCYAESPDGIHWIKPALGLSEWEGSRENNIILGLEQESNFDNFMVFRDDNPACPPEERYKGISSFENRGKEVAKRQLFAYVSADGLRFTRKYLITEKGKFDSLNVAFWDARAERYRCYIRDLHDVDQPHKGIRDIRYLESEDFVHWSDPQPLVFNEVEDSPLYTNGVQPYFRAPQMLVGFPTRYTERQDWNGSFEELCGKEKRQQRMTDSRRHGLAITDGLFMASHDGLHFHRFDEAFVRPDVECGTNWIYGDGYVLRGMAVTPSVFPGAPDEISIYMCDYHWMRMPPVLRRYGLRMDGFASLHADFKEETVVTKPFTYTGENLFVNFATAARGYMYFTLTCEGKDYESCETFGNAIDRKVVFEEGVVKALAGKDVTLTVRMRDADLYAIRFS